MSKIIEPTRTGPTVKRGQSRGDYCTPPEFLDAVQDRFGYVMFDLAATRENQVVGAGDPKGGPCYFGPDHEDPKKRDSLKQDWSALRGVAWCNPPFDPLRPWLEKASEVSGRAGWTLLLCPASVSTEWFADLVHGRALVMPLRPRLTFVGETDPYPRDLVLLAYGFGVSGFEPWRWSEGKRRSKR